MLRACYLLRDSINKIQRMSKSITVNSDLDVLKTRIRFEYRNSLVFINELLNILVDPGEVEQAQDELDSSYNIIMDSDDWEEIKAEVTAIDVRVLGNYIERLDDYDLTAKAKAHHYKYCDALDLVHNDLRNIGSIIKSPNSRPLNILDAKCKSGNNLNIIKNYTDATLNIYGMEIETSLANEAKNKNIFEKIAKGGLEGTRCSNNVFDMAFFYPELEMCATLTQMGTLKARKEFEDLKKVTNYIRYDGVLLFVIPYYRLTTQVCNYISKFYKDVNLYRVTDWNGLVLLTAVKKIYNQDGDEEIYNKIRQVSLNLRNALDLEDARYIQYELPAALATVETFRGNILDDEDIKDIVNSTSLYDSFMTKQANILDSNENKRPLLPFNLGQIGLVLTSGCLDGKVEEFDGQYHVIKGMVKKEEMIQELEGEKRGDKEVIITNINKVQIKIITPNGILKTLA